MGRLLQAHVYRSGQANGEGENVAPSATAFIVSAALITSFLEKEGEVAAPGMVSAVMPLW